MPTRREVIAMTPQEVDAYLREQRRIILVTIGPDGFPHPLPMNYGIDDEGCVILTSFAKAQKVKNLERDSRATLLVESGHNYSELRSVILYCDTEIIRDFDECERLRKFMRVANATAAPQRRDQIDATMHKRVVMRFTARKVVSWDHSKLGAAY
jgi:nitroimidazol reductase NimA-like FMN-containing flavoprotein (pyridoxamine 5'-phosphate oxidase superfamily)